MKTPDLEKLARSFASKLKKSKNREAALRVARDGVLAFGPAVDAWFRMVSVFLAASDVCVSAQGLEQRFNVAIRLVNDRLIKSSGESLYEAMDCAVVRILELRLEAEFHRESARKADQDREK